MRSHNGLSFGRENTSGSLLALARRDQLIELMEQLGGAATLGTLNREVDSSRWNTITPWKKNAACDL